MKQIVNLKKYQKRLLKVKGTEKNRIFKSYKNMYFFKSLVFRLLTDYQLKAVFNSMQRYLKKAGKVILYVFPRIGLTKKPAGVRMGKGKGSKISHYGYQVRPGKILFGIKCSNDKLALDAIRIGLSKLAIKGCIKKV